MFLKEKIKDIVYFFINFLPRRNGVAVLMYHSVGDNNIFFTVRAREFEKQMSHIKKQGYRVVSVAELIEILRKDKKLPKKAVVLTFDDGYEDNYINVFPVLKKYNFPVTIFLATDYIGKSMNNRQNILLKMLNWQQIEEMHQSGLISFEPHSHTHRRLDRISPEELEQEIKKSRQIIEKRLNKKCCFSAYPLGKYNQPVEHEFKRQDFKAIFTIQTGLVRKNDNLFELRRISINSKITFPRFKAKLKGWILTKEWLKKIIKV